MERAGKHMKGKITALTLCAMLFALCGSAEAQQAKKVSRIGALHLGTTKVAAPFIEAFERGLKELGYVIGSNIRVEYIGMRREKQRDIHS